MTTPNHQFWPVRMALVSCNQLAQVGLRGILKSTPGIQLIGESSGGAHACTLVQRMKPNCLIIDLESDSNLVESVMHYKQLSPQTRVILFAGWNDMARARAAIAAGAEGIVLKSQPPSVLVVMIEGEEAVSPATTPAISDVQPASDNKKTQPRTQKTRIEQSPQVNSLTERERTVIALIGEGLSNRDISKRLSISDITVRHHLTKIFGKLGVVNRQNLLISAYHLGLVDLPTSAQGSPISSSPA